jgi:hypothetical protein
MADNPHFYGFRPAKGHESFPLGIQRVRVASGYSPTVGGNNVNVNVGDPVKKVNDGTVALCAAGDAVYGVVVGIAKYYDTGLGRMSYRKYLPFNTVYGSNLERQSILYIYPAQGAIFEIDCDDKTTFTTQATYTAAIGENADQINVGDTTNQTVNPQLDISTHATTNTLVWRIVDISPWMDVAGDFTGLYTKLFVTANVVQDAPYQTTGV